MLILKFKFCQDRAEKLKKKSSLDELIEKLRKDADREQVCDS